MNNEVIDVLTLIEDIQEHLNFFLKEFKQYSYERGVKKDQIIKCMKELCRSMDSHIESSLLEMYQRSVRKFKDLIMYLTLGIYFHEGNVSGLSQTNKNCSIFDYYLSKNIYIMKHQAMEKYRMVPASMKACMHPKLLACQKMPDLWRRASYISHVVIHVSNLVKKGTSL